MPSWVQDPSTGKLIPKHEYRPPAPKFAAIHGDIETFKSPIDGSIISDRAQLRKHNARHGVTDARDYSKSYYKQAADKRQSILNSTHSTERAARINTLNAAWDMHNN